MTITQASHTPLEKFARSSHIASAASTPFPIPVLRDVKYSYSVSKSYLTKSYYANDMFAKSRLAQCGLSTEATRSLLFARCCALSVRVDYHRASF